MYENHPCEHDLYTECDDNCKKNREEKHDNQIQDKDHSLLSETTNQPNDSSSKIIYELSDIQTEQKENEETAQIQVFLRSSDN